MRRDFQRYISTMPCTAVLAVIFFFVLLSTASAQSNTFPSSGSVGIGTTSPNGAQLHIFENTVNGADGLKIENGSASGTYPYLQLGQAGSSGWGVIDWANSGLVEGTASGGLVLSGYAGPIKFQTARTTRAIIDSSGNMGIGTTTPGRKLEVLANDGEAVRLYRNVNNVGYGVNLKFAFNNSNNAKLDFAGIHGLVQANNAGAEQGTLVFTTASAGTLSEKLRIDASGNVGIGTSSPVTKLDINGNLNIQGGTTFFRQSSGLAGNEGTYLAIGATGNNESSVSLNVYRAGVYTTRFSVNNWGQVILQPNADAAVGIGTATPNSSYRLDVNGNTNVSGNINVTGNINAKYQDVAEWVPSTEQLSAGTVVVLDPTKSNQVISSTQVYDTRVAGVVSERPGIALGEKSDNKVLVATTGRVRVKVDASRSPIHIGDLLVTSDIPGAAMKSEPVNIGGVQLHRPGTLIGKALEPLEKGSGTILVLLSLQ